MLRGMTALTFPLLGSTRSGRISEPGRICLVTFTTDSRRRMFAEWELARIAARSLCDAHAWRDSHLLCWVLMPEHWHGLIELGAQESLSNVVRRLKATSARAVNLASGHRGALWMSGFHDHAIRHDEELIAIARYVVLNPVRAGLVARIGRYPFWDAMWLDQRHRG
jgi:REP element-mobilizing transposase RayT